jgi:hypothetical protein
MDKSKIDIMVDPGTNYKKEKVKRYKKALPKNTQHSTKREPQKDIAQGKIQLPSNN